MRHELLQKLLVLTLSLEAALRQEDLGDLASIMKARAKALELLDLEQLTERERDILADIREAEERVLQRMKDEKSHLANVLVGAFHGRKRSKVYALAGRVETTFEDKG